MVKFNNYNIFESVVPEEDFDVITQEILYQYNMDELEHKYTKEEFLALSNTTKKNIFEELKLNLGFVFSFGVTITAFFPIVQSFIVNSGIDDIMIDKSTVVYLGICALSIALNKPKASYKKLFDELRLRNVYGLLKDLTKFIHKMKIIFKYVCSYIGLVCDSILSMFNYTALFVPFALTLSKLLTANTITLDEIIVSITDNGGMKLASIALGITGITIRELIKSLIIKIKEFNFNDYKNILSKSFQSVSASIINIKNKINLKKLDTDLESMEIESEHEILKFNQWVDMHDVERIDDNKKEFRTEVI